MRYFYICTALLLALFSGSAAGLLSDEREPISIQANSAEVDNAGGVSIYRGNVRIQQGGIKIFAHEVELLLHNSEVKRIVARGSQQKVRYEQQLETGAGSILAEAASLTYEAATEQLRLEGDASLIQAEDRVAGDRITYNIEDDTWTAFSAGVAPVSIVIRPQQGARQ